MNFPILIAALLVLTSFSSNANAIESDYCVADTSLPQGPSGYSCKDPSKITADDFSYSGLATPANTSNVFKFGVSYALVDQFPALNGLDIAFVRADLGAGGAGPIHAHRISELVFVSEGKIVAGFIDTNNKAFYKTLEKGDLFIFPAGLFHFQVNVGDVPAVLYAAFAGPNPGVSVIDFALFRSDLPADIVQKTTLLDIEQIKKLKGAFGGKSV